MTEIIVRQPTTRVAVAPGSGAPGPAGPPGPGVPAGGSDGDIVVKDGTDPYEFTTVGKGTFVQSAAATGAAARTGTDNSTIVTPLALAGATPSVTVAPSGDTTGATDTAAIQAAIDLAPVRIALKPGTFYVDGLTLKSDVTLQGAGRDATIIRLADGSNTDVLVSEGFSTLTGGTTTGGPTGFKIADLTIDGNRTSNTAGWCLRVYARKYTIDNVAITEGKSGGVWTQWGSGGTNMESHWSNFKIYNCEGNLLHNLGPHDSLFTNGSIFNDSTLLGSTGTLTLCGTGSAGSQWTNVHFWGHCAVAVQAGETTFFTNCAAEGASAASGANLLMSGNGSVWTGGHIFGTNAGAFAEYGVKFGSGAACTGNQVIGARFSQFGPLSAPVNWGTSGGNNTVIGSLENSTCTTMSVSTKQATDTLIMRDPGGTASLAGVGDLARLHRMAERCALWLPGSAGSYVSAPDSAALSITSDITIVAHIAPDDWTPAAAGVLVGKRASASQYSYRLILTTAGALQFAYSPDGTDASAVALTSTANLGALAAGVARFVAVTFDADDGGGNKVARFWWSLDGRIWTQLGATVTNAGTATIFDSTAAVELGANVVGTANLYIGKLHSASISSGIGASGVVGGTEVLAFDADASRGQRYRDAYGNVFTINGSAWALMDA